ncbi:hypothetical protein FACS1894205_0480 [Alphaproteobacteria bacterium]|nr:hypothetical protein FACS1894205_0480 [Alphaproteobacteria bacterium]
MVFKKSGKMRYGHVAVVSEVEHSRKLTIHHANWGGGRGKIATDIAVIDVSPRNDWSQVRVWNRGAGIFGRVYPIYGFIYPARQGGVVQAINKRPAPAEPVLVPPVEFSAVSPIRFDVPPPIEPVPRVESVMASSIEPVVEPAALPVERVVVAIAAERPARTPPAEKRPAAKQNEVVATNDMDAVLARKFGSGQYGAAK